MSNWDLIKESRVNIVKDMYKEYKTTGKLYKFIYSDYCVVSCCKECSFKSYVDNQCVVGNSDCIRCWRDFMEFLDTKNKKSNVEVYDE